MRHKNDSVSDEIKRLRERLAAEKAANTARVREVFDRGRKQDFIAFVEQFERDMMSDDGDRPETRGRQMMEAIINNDVSDFIMAACGYTVGTLLDNMDSDGVAAEEGLDENGNDLDDESLLDIEPDEVEP